MLSSSWLWAQTFNATFRCYQDFFFITGLNEKKNAGGFSSSHSVHTCIHLLSTPPPDVSHQPQLFVNWYEAYWSGLKRSSLASFHHINKRIIKDLAFVSSLYELVLAFVDEATRRGRDDITCFTTWEFSSYAHHSLWFINRPMSQKAACGGLLTVWL